MRAALDKISISDFKNNMTKFTRDPAIEAVLTRNGKPIGVYVGINTWRATQETLSLLRKHPKELLESLVLHQRFQKTGKPVGISLKELSSLIEQGT